MRKDGRGHYDQHDDDPPHVWLWVAAAFLVAGALAWKWLG